MTNLTIAIAKGDKAIDLYRKLYTFYWGLYAQDDWSLSRTFTLFAGLRWETNRTRTERYDRMSVLDFGLPSPIDVRKCSAPMTWSHR